MRDVARTARPPAPDRRSPRSPPTSARLPEGTRRAGGRADGRITRVVLSDRTIARLIADGRIGIDPYDEALLQPSSVDVRVDRYFRVFHNARYPYIDVKEPQDELTEEVEIDGRRAVHPPSRRVRARLDARAGHAARRPRRPPRGEVLAGQARPPHPLDRRLHRPRLGRPRDARAVERREPSDHDLPRDEDRTDLLHADDRAGGAPYGSSTLGSKYQGQRGPTPSRYWQNFGT